MAIDLGNKRDITDYMLHVHRCPQSSTSTSVSVDGSGGGFKTAASEVSSIAEVEVKVVVSLAEDYIRQNT